jgi:hypothetical protein
MSPTNAFVGFVGLTDPPTSLNAVTSPFPCVRICVHLLTSYVRRTQCQEQPEGRLLHDVRLCLQACDAHR